jgi:SAM-dependent methyltransferase
MSASKSAPTERFSDRVDDYIKYRPHYSGELVEALRQACALTRESVIADVGCGTGLLAKIFLENGNPVIGVEPNQNMRLAGEQFLAGFERFRMLEGTAEDTALPDRAVDFVVAGQAFHWFQPDATRREFARIVKPGGWVVLLWHDRDVEATPFLRGYEGFLQRYAIEYSTLARNKIANYRTLERFFAPGRMDLIEQDAQQRFDLDGLRGRLLSSSYAPREGPAAEAMLQALPSLFDHYAQHGKVTLQYKTRIYYGHLSA